jgi:hypothetical protein
MKRFSKFVTAVFCVSIATVALGTEPVPLEYKTAIDLQNNHLFNQNAVTSFVYNTFYMFDKHVPVEQLLKNLVEENLNMQFPEATLKSKEDFKRWYAGIGENIKSNTHKVQSVDVNINANNTYSARVIVLWQAESKKGEFLKFKVEQKWTLVAEQGRLKIKEYLVSKAN